MLVITVGDSHAVIVDGQGGGAAKHGAVVMDAGAALELQGFRPTQGYVFPAASQPSAKQLELQGFRPTQGYGGR
jgi:hypothetical protein